MHKALPFKIKASIAFRILLIAVCCFIIPLFFHSLFLYYKNFRFHIEDLHQHLQLIQQGKVFYLNSVIQEKEQNLQKLFSFLSTGSKDQQKVFQSFGKKGESAIFLAELKQDKMCLQQTPTCFNQSQIQQGKGAFVFWDEQKKENALYVYYREKNRALFSRQSLRSLLSPLQKDSSTIHASFVFLSGKVAATTNPSLQGKTLQLPNQDIAQPFFLQKEPKTLASMTLVPSLQLFFLLDIPVKTALYKYEHHLEKQILTFLLFFCLLGGSLAFFLLRRLTKPLKQLYGVLYSIEQGKSQSRFVKDRWGFEINDLGFRLNSAMDALLLEQKKTQEQRIAKQVLKKELTLGLAIQKEILPAQFPPSQVEVGASFVPALEVSGDFYDFMVRDQTRFFLGIADVSGKGLEGCLFSFLLRNLLRAYVQTSLSFQEIVEKTNALFRKDAQTTSMFATSWLAEYDSLEHTLTYTNLGHPPALLYRGGTIESLYTPGIPLGIEDRKPVIETITLEKQDLLVLYTDGMIEEQNEKGQAFGKELWKKWIKDHQDLSCRVFAKEAVTTVNQYRAQKTDDLAVMALRF